MPKDYLLSQAVKNECPPQYLPFKQNKHKKITSDSLDSLKPQRKNFWLSRRKAIKFVLIILFLSGIIIIESKGIINNIFLNHKKTITVIKKEKQKYGGLKPKKS